MSSSFKNYIDRNITAIIGTLLFHVLLLAILNYILIQPGTPEKYEVIKITFPEDDMQIDPKVKKYMYEFKDQGNKAVNEAAPDNIAKGNYNKFDKPDISESSKNKIDEQIKRKLKGLEEEVIKEQRESGYGYTEEEAAKLLSSARERTLDHIKPQKPRSEAAYKGPTNITYKLENRYDVYLKVPVYLCQYGGQVTVNIAVNRDGKVVSVKVDKETSETHDPCLVEAALRGAYNTYFNKKADAPKLQKGSITYIFVPQ